jgi:hypothetical protein
MRKNTGRTLKEAEREHIISILKKQNGLLVVRRELLRGSE